MSVFRETEIEWNGKTYKFVPSMALLRDIEREVSIMHVAATVFQGQPRLSHMAFIISRVMRHAGANVQEDEIAAELASGDAVAVMGLYRAVMDAISPQPPSEKKDGGKRKKR